MAPCACWAPRRGALYFAADDGTTGWELWKTDGTPVGTALVQNIAPDDGGIVLSQRDDVAARGDTLVFDVDPAASREAFEAGAAAQRSTPAQAVLAANDPPSAIAGLWQSDGTAAGTTELRPFPSTTARAAVRDLTTLGDSVLFSGVDTDDVRELWRSDGMPAGTAILTNTVRPHFGLVFNLTRLNNLAVFDVYTSTLAAQPREFTSLWASDGTPAGTRLIRRDLTLGRAAPAASGPTLFFASSIAGSQNVELWATDGSATGTRHVSEIAGGEVGSFPQAITPGRPGEVFFLALTESSAYQLWKSDGTTAGTTFVYDEVSGSSELAYAGGTLYFTSYDSAHGTELWASDGTTAGTRLVADVYPGAGSSNPENLLGLNGVLYFTATGPDGQRTLWRSDGTSAGTHPLRSDTNAPLNPSDLTAVHGQVLFSAADDAHGREVWRSDGTQAGTTMMQDIVPGAGSSNPHTFVEAGKQVYLTADTPGVGRELWAIAPTLAPGEPTPTPTPPPRPAARQTGVPAAGVAVNKLPRRASAM